MVNFTSIKTQLAVFLSLSAVYSMPAVAENAEPKTAPKKNSKASKKVAIKKPSPDTAVASAKTPAEPSSAVETAKPAQAPAPAVVPAPAVKNTDTKAPPSLIVATDDRSFDSDAVSEALENEKAILPSAVSDLATALAFAYQNNQALQAKRREILATNQTIGEARSSFLPQLSVSGRVVGNNTRYTNDKLPQTSQSTSSRAHNLEGKFTLSQNLFAGGATMASITKADQSIRKDWAELMSTEQETFSSVIKSLLDLQSKILKVEAQTAYRAAMQKSYDTSFEKHKIGEETITQVAISESKLMEADAKLRSAMADVKGAEADFVSKTNGTPVNLKTPLAPTGLPENLEKAIDIALSNHPKIISAQYDYGSAKAGIDQANAQLYSPSIDLEASSTRTGANTRSQGSSPNNAGVYNPYENKAWARNTNNQIGVTMSYQLYSGGKYSSQKRRAHDTALAKRFAIENMKGQVRAAVQSAYATWKSAQENIVNYQKQVKAAEIAVASTRQENEVGTKVLKDVLDQEYNLVQARLAAIDAEKDYLTAAYKMVELMGGLHARALKLNVPYFDPKAHYEGLPFGF